jgi:peptidyl-prolyl cis-trans isomerase C
MLLAEEGARLLAADAAAASSTLGRERDAVLIRRLRVLETGSAEVDSSAAVAAFERMRVRRRVQTVSFAEEREAQAARERLDRGEPFESLRTQEISEVPERERWVAWSPQVDVVADAIADAPPGSIIGPLRTRSGWLLVRVVELAAHDPGTIDELRIQSHQGLKGRREIEATERLVERLRAEAGFRLHEAAIARLVARTAASMLAPGATEGDPDWALPKLEAGEDSLRLAATGGRRVGRRPR